MYGRPDLIAAGTTLKSSFAQWLSGFNGSGLRMGPPEAFGGGYLVSTTISG